MIDVLSSVFLSRVICDVDSVGSLSVNLAGTTLAQRKRPAQ